MRGNPLAIWTREQKVGKLSLLEVSYTYYDCFQGLPFVIMCGPLAKAVAEKKTQDGKC